MIEAAEVVVRLVVFGLELSSWDDLLGQIDHVLSVVDGFLVLCVVLVSDSCVVDEVDSFDESLVYEECNEVCEVLPRIRELCRFKEPGCLDGESSLGGLLSCDIFDLIELTT